MAPTVRTQSRLPTTSPTRTRPAHPRAARRAELTRSARVLSMGSPREAQGATEARTQGRLWESRAGTVSPPPRQHRQAYSTAKVGLGRQCSATAVVMDELALRVLHDRAVLALRDLEGWGPTAGSQWMEPVVRRETPDKVAAGAEAATLTVALPAEAEADVEGVEVRARSEAAEEALPSASLHLTRRFRSKRPRSRRPRVETGKRVARVKQAAAGAAAAARVHARERLADPGPEVVGVVVAPAARAWALPIRARPRGWTVSRWRTRSRAQVSLSAQRAPSGRPEPVELAIRRPCRIAHPEETGLPEPKGRRRPF